MAILLQDVRFALRAYLRSPIFALIAILTIALGIGANTAVFSIVDSLILRPLPYPDSDRLVFIDSVDASGRTGNLSFPDFDDWRKQNQTFAGIASYRGESLVITGGPAPINVDAFAVSANFFDVLGVQPALGRGFAPDEEEAGKNQVIVLTHPAWKKHFGGDPAILGRTLIIDDLPYTVIGVLGESFRLAVCPPARLRYCPTPALDGGERFAALVPMPRPFDIQLRNNRGTRNWLAIARLRPGVTIAQASDNLAAIAAAQAVAYPDSNASRGVRVTALQDRVTQEGRLALLMLLGAVAFVLLIACANVANLLLARANARQREIAIRIVLGAGRARVVRQMLTESVLLAVGGAGLGVLLALWGIDALRSLIPANLASVNDIVIDARVLAFTTVLAVATGLAFGLWPALQASHQNPSDALKEAGLRSTMNAARPFARNLLVVVEVLAATLLLVGAGLMLRSFARVSQVDPGFRPEGLVTTHVTLPLTRYREPAQMVNFYQQLNQRLETLPGQEGIAVGTPLPFSGSNISRRFTIDGVPPPPSQPNIAAMSLVSPTFFSVLGIPLRQGRTFTRRDDDPEAPPVMVVNDAFVEKFIPVASAIGRKISVRSWLREEEKVYEIVGVVGDVHVQTLERATGPAMYVPFAQAVFNHFGIAVRTSATTGIAAVLREIVAGIDKDQPLGAVETMNQWMRASMLQRRLSTLLLAIFGGVALALALIGVYGVMSYTVAQRQGEMGIRMALGARPLDVMRMMVGRGVALALAGLGLGLLLAFPLARLLGSLLWGVAPSDPLTYAGIAALLLGVAALASWLPARRAARVDPSIALRAE